MQDNDEDAYPRPDLPVDERVGDLLDRMTLEEKAGQLVGTWAGQTEEFHTLEDAKRAVRERGHPRRVAVFQADTDDLIVDSFTETSAVTEGRQ